eukprot:m.168591 g.168591  ORF g.168591 m.168591 type:complete len:346 (-) comp15261_c18_seq1:25-1062(-)
MLDFGSAVVVSLQAIGTFLTMLVAGFFLRKTGRFSDELSKGLATVGLYVAIPCLLFTSMVYCEQDYSDNACPELSDAIRNGWPLFLWPIVVICMGLLMARVIVYPFGNVPPTFRKTAAVATAFGNSTGLAITLLAAIHKSYNPHTDPLGIVDPTQYLAVYLLLYPLLQWTLGGYLVGVYKPRKPLEIADSSTQANLDQRNAALALAASDPTAPQVDEPLQEGERIIIPRRSANATPTTPTSRSAFALGFSSAGATQTPPHTPTHSAPAAPSSPLALTSPGYTHSGVPGAWPTAAAAAAAESDAAIAAAAADAAASEDSIDIPARPVVETARPVTRAKSKLRASTD